MENKTIKKESEEIHLHQNNELEEVIGIVPNLLVRKGILFICGIILLMFVGLWYFRYPEFVVAETKIIANNPPIYIDAKSNGKIENLFVKDNQEVKENEILAIIENTANYEDILKTKELLDSLAVYMDNNIISQFNISSDIYNLGNVQNSFSLFLKQFNDYKNFIKLNYYNKMIESVKKEISQQKDYREKLNLKAYYAKEQLILYKRQFQRDSTLYKSEVLSTSDFERSENQLLQLKNNYESFNTDVLSVGIQITKLEQQLMEFESLAVEQNSQKFINFKASYEQVITEIKEWEKAFLLKSPVKGKVTFTNFWKNNQNIKVGEIAFTVVPTDFKYYVAKIYLPIKSSGEVIIGQNVIINLEDYPYMEYGFIKGSITNISLVTDRSIYVAEVTLPSKLVTSYGKELTLKNELSGESKIIIKNQRLINKIIYPLKYLFQKNNI